MAPPISLLLFGAQQARWTRPRLQSLQKDLVSDPSLRFLQHCLEQLDVSLATPFGCLADAAQPVGLAEFARGGEIPQPDTLANTQLAALTVALHAIEWLRSAADARIIVQGFCIGFLSAAVVSSTQGNANTDFQRYITNAIRLAACLGRIVDAEDASHAPADRATVISVRCLGLSDRAALDATLDSIPGAYVSCVTDDRNVTVTIPRFHLESLTQRLKRESIPVKAIGLNGSYHHPKNAEAAEQLKALCARTPDLQLPSAEQLRLPFRSTADTELIASGSLHEISIDLILCKRANWFQTVKRSLEELPSPVKLVSIGPESHIPSSLSNTRTSTSRTSLSHPHEEIAVVGMACRFPQADTLEEFWQLISSGGTAFGSLPPNRFDPAQVLREPRLPTFWGNFLRQPQVFDHRFFGISGREAKSMDPQQRLALQVAYEAMESTSYFSLPSPAQEKDIGCYLGVGAVDYEGNVASENANAFSATGTLRAFVPGRISHFFGWTGPSMTFDTACSSSAVAISTACKALLAGDCAMAIAGGVNVITNPNLHQNLAAASFLNPNGSSCAFDASAAGYCRGEGAGIVVLKPLSKAIEAGDSILAVVAGSAVNQSSNLSPITVPDSQSQSALYQRALTSAHIDARDVQYVEAHGTGTQVGDPIEYESVRLALTGDRTEDLALGSVKDNIGHAEAASGAAGIIKLILMMQKKKIPKQANFVTLNPRIKASDQIQVPKTTRSWDVSRPVALLNNYGASGNNAALVLRGFESSSSPIPDLATYPIILAAKSSASLKAYASELKRVILTSDIPLSRLSYALARRQNPSLGYRLAFKAQRAADVIQALESAIGDTDATSSTSLTRSIVLVFGGQTGRMVTMSKDLYTASPVLRKELDECAKICEELGLPSILSGIFSGEPIQDLVQLHCMLLSMQISYARAWLACGLRIDSMIGHSFGQISALCVANSISTRDAFRFIAGRARLIRDRWGPDCGAMLSIECDESDLENIVDRANATDDFRVDIACYNGPRSFVLAGNTRSIDWIENECRTFKTTRLQNSHAYHSHVTEGIMDELKDLATSIPVRRPGIHVETCTRDASWSEFSASAIAEHTRQPVYFLEAIRRVANRLQSAVWLEAGSATPVISMARRVLSESTGSHTFIPTELGRSDAMVKLADASCQLWSAGIDTRIPFWPFYGLGRVDHVDLPPYQFEQTQHWIEYNPGSKQPNQPSQAPASALVTKLDGMGKDGSCTFAVDTANAIFELTTSGHAVAGQSLCPASMYVELATQSAMILLDGTKKNLLPPYVEDLVMSAPLGLGANLFVQLRSVTTNTWAFTLFSESSNSKRTEHGKGRISFPQSGDIVSQAQLKLLQRMIPSSTMDRIMDSSAATSIRGTIVYQLFSEIVEYKAYYRGVRSVSALGNEAVGLVDISDVPRPLDKRSTSCNPIELDNFLQVAGIHVNCLSPRRKSEVFMCTAVDEVILTPSFSADKIDAQSWKVYSRYETIGDGIVTNNIFVYDLTNNLVVAITGATFRSVVVKSLVRSLSRLNLLGTVVPEAIKEDIELQADSGYQTTSPVLSASPASEQDVENVPRREAPGPPISERADPGDMLKRLRDLLSSIIEIPVEEVTPSSSLENLGIDSLLVTEVLWEIQQRLKIQVTQEQFMDCEDILSLCYLLEGKQKPEPRARSEPIGVAPDVKAVKIEDAMPTKSQCIDSVVQQCFSESKHSFDAYADTTGLSGFFAGPFLLQSQLVVQYVLDAFATLGCSIGELSAGDVVPMIPFIEAQKKLIPQLYKILEDAKLIVRSKDTSFKRTETPVPSESASSLLSTLLSKYPQHTSEMKLLHTTGHQLAECLSGTADPISLIFRDASARALLEDVYTNAPMFKTGTLILSQYLSSVVTQLGGSRKLRILELGGGTGGTTKQMVATLAKLGSSSDFTYTFTDLSSSLVAAARKKFSQWEFMRYSVLDVEKAPGPELSGQYDIIISTNCIHATQNLTKSTTHIRQMLRSDGILCLIELTRNLFWFDLVFGLLSGWWLFNDGRTHVLADEGHWSNCLREAGFNWIDWSDGSSKESDLLRVITASPSVALSPPVQKETLTFKNVDDLALEADIYYPAEVVQSKKPLPVALMIHGGGHIMLSRDDVRPEQTMLLLNQGFLPISVDYRLCPEVTLVNGPMCDVSDALTWIRTVLPGLALSRKDIKVDGDQVVAIGWSTGGTLALSLGWTSIERGIKPPEAILVFYCPLDYEDEFWMQENIPRGSESSTGYDLDDSIWGAVSDKPITRWNVSPSKRAMGGWMAPTDPRSRLALHMNWKGRTLHVLLNGLNARTREQPKAPTAAEKKAVSPLAHARDGTYRTPTFILYAREDDLIPWQQAQRMDEALKHHGIDSQTLIVDGVPHLFDLYREYQKQEHLKKVVRQGYEFLQSHIS